MFSVAGIKTDVGGSDTVSPTPYRVLFRTVTQTRFGQVTKLVFIVVWLLFSILGLISSGWFLLWVIPIRQIPVMVALGIVLLLRRSRLQVDVHMAPNAFLGFLQGLKDKSFWTLLLSYLVSANLVFFTLRFSLWHVPLRLPRKESVDIPPNLNEQHVYLMTFLPNVLSVLYTYFHYALNYDLLSFPVFSARLENGRSTMSPYKRIIAMQADIAFMAATYSLAIIVIAPIIYYFFRSSLWNFSLILLGSVLNINVIGYPNSYPIGLRTLWTSFYSSFIVFWLWEFTNTSFSTYLSLGPLCRHKLISDRSNNPEFALLDGLHNKDHSLFTRVTAFQELLHIATNFPERRVVIYSTDVNKAPDTLWSRYMNECLDIINETCASLGKPRKSLTANSKPKTSFYSGLNPSGDVPKRLSRPNAPDGPGSSTIGRTLRLNHRNDIFKASHQDNGSNREGRDSEPFVKKIHLDNQDNGSKSIDFFSKIAESFRSTLTWILEFRVVVDEFLASPLGEPFRCTTERTVANMIPVIDIVISAVLSLTAMVCHSMDEDEFGTVQKTIPAIMDALDDLLNATETIIDNPPIHWTDVYTKQGKQRPRMRPVFQVQETAASGFEHIVTCFKMYLDNIPLSEKVQERVRATLEDFVFDQLESESSMYE